jgi:quinol-cytochrome oxidoreductase complex cytochrome b subunit
MYFLLIPLWALCLILGAAFLFVSRFRYVGLCFLSVSTGALVFLTVLPLAFASVVTMFTHDDPGGLFLLLTFPLGAALGIAAGLTLARRIANRLGVRTYPGRK